MSCQVAALIIAVRLAGFGAGPGRVTLVEPRRPSNRYQALARGHGPRLPADRLRQCGEYSQLDILATRETGRVPPRPVAGTMNAGKPYQGHGPALSGWNDGRTRSPGIAGLTSDFGFNHLLIPVFACTAGGHKLSLACGVSTRLAFDQHGPQGAYAWSEGLCD
jgi:hypothetical protein